ncbi:ABC transporter substrate-binding protein [Halobacterium wangiae]|uniref:ABC transporter substrate-binding protein n=1 Tax=Halobacterium wangiae TaxID=2902623 RepID=UPI001E624730|nr:ABC transporter substrate-binding protein [Halobacterium wangiae]
MTRPSLSRRAFLASAVSASLAGCNGVRYRDRYSPGTRVSLTVSAPPADDDQAATMIARELADRLSALGVDASFEPKGQSQLYLDALINNDFDVFVGRHPGLDHPDALYSLLHSSFASEPGWQNPFGVTSVAIDDSLEAIRAADDPAAELDAFLDAYTERVPFAVVAEPEFLTARRRELSVEADALTARPIDVLQQLADVALDRPLRAGIFSAEVTENRNPIAGEFRWNDQLLGLLYDSLARPARDSSSYLPWAAEDWYFDDELVVELRPDQQFHDGSPLTADDVAFTVDFLSDTALGDAASPVPATRFRGRTTLVSSVRATDSTTVRFDLEPDVGPRTAERVLTLPILPAAEWRDRTNLVKDRVTQALVWENPNPVGSGPFAFDGATEDESVRLRPFAEHFLADVDDDPVTRYAGALDSEGLVARYAPSGEDAIAALRDGRLDTSLHSFPLNAFGGITDDVVTSSGGSNGLYVVGYNLRRAPLSDFRFRQVLARLHDREHTVASVFGDVANATDLPVIEKWGVDETTTDEHSVGPFPGWNGELDVERGRELFESIGLTYDDEENLYR